MNQQESLWNKYIILMADEVAAAEIAADASAAWLRLLFTTPFFLDFNIIPRVLKFFKFYNNNYEFNMENAHVIFW